jgi:hypothetical protein
MIGLTRAFAAGLLAWWIGQHVNAGFIWLAAEVGQMSGRLP